MAEKTNEKVISDIIGNQIVKEITVIETPKVVKDKQILTFTISKDNYNLNVIKERMKREYGVSLVRDEETKIVFENEDFRVEFIKL